MKYGKNSQTQLLRDLIFPLLYLLSIMWLDHITPHTTITPLFGIIALLVMSIYLLPIWMIFWASVYSGVVLSVFLLPVWGFFIRWSSPTHDQFTPYVRSITFVAAAVMASWLCMALNNLKRTNKDLRSIFDCLDSPIIASDHNGKIHYFNTASEKIFSGADQLSVGSSIFKLAPADKKGKMIADYLSRFKTKKFGYDRNINLEFQKIRLKGTTHLMDSTYPKLLITIISID